MFADRRILIADDDRALRDGVADLLGELDERLQFLHAENGNEALRILRLRPAIDLALLDMHMPERTGLEVLSTLRLETLTVPCIFISGGASDGVCAEALRAGARAVLRKPLEPRLLRDEVRRVLWAPRGAA